MLKRNRATIEVLLGQSLVTRNVTKMVVRIETRLGEVILDEALRPASITFRERTMETVEDVELDGDLVADATFNAFLPIESLVERINSASFRVVLRSRYSSASLDDRRQV